MESNVVASEALDKFSRYRFQDHDFLSQWKFLQKFVKYRSIGDYVYGDRHFTSAKHLQESLDKVSIPTLYSIFQQDEAISIGAEDHDLIHLRKLVCAELHGSLDDNDDGSLDDEQSSTSEGNQKSDDWKPPKVSFRSTSKPYRVADKNRSAISYDAGTDQYLKKRKRRQTASSIDGRFPSLEETIAHAKGLDTAECEKIEAQYAKDEFHRWKFLLYAMHSLILYGNGSKRKLVAEFCENELQEDGDILQIDAIDNEVSAASIIGLLSDLFRSHVSSNLTLVENAETVGKAIQTSCNESNEAMFLVIYNLECILQRNPADWQAIETLSCYVRILATVDDVDTPSLMSSCTSFVWIALHTQRPYVRELAKLEFLQEGSSRQSTRSRQRELSESRILEVLRNLAPRYAEVMQVLARLQMKVRVTDEHTADIGGGWVNYKDFREECKNNFLIDKDSKLRSLQTELKDHGLMVDKLDATGEFVMIPFPTSKLQAIQDLKVKLAK